LREPSEKGVEAKWDVVECGWDQGNDGGVIALGQKKLAYGWTRMDADKKQPPADFSYLCPSVFLFASQFKKKLGRTLDRATGKELSGVVVVVLAGL